MLMVQNRRAKAAWRLKPSQAANASDRTRSAVGKLKSYVERMQSKNLADHLMLESDSVDLQIEDLERSERVERLLSEIKGQRRLS